MIKNLFSSQSKTITGAAIILGLASFVSRIAGMLRDRMLAQHFGAGDTLDAYYAAFRIPDLMFNLLIAGALSAGFIPVFLDIWNKNKSKAWELTSTVLNLIFIGFAGVSIVLYIFAPAITHFMTPGFDPAKTELAVRLTRIMLLAPVFLAISSVVSSVLNSLKHFAVFAISPILYNLGIIIGVIFFVPYFGANGLAWGVVLGAILHVSIQLPALFHHGYAYRPILSLRDPAVRKITLLTIPRTLGLATQQINFLIITIIASTLSAGSVTIFNFAHNLQYFPIGLISHSFAIAAFPTFAALVAENKIESMTEHLSLTIRQVLFLIVPATIAFLLLRAQIVRVVLGTGQFDWADTVLTADTLAFFVLSLFAQSIVLILARAYYALKDTWTPFIVAIITVAVNIVAALYLKEMLGVRGLALAFSLSVSVELAIMWILLHRKLETLHEARLLVTIYKLSIAGLVMGLVVQFSKHPLAALVDMTKFWGILTQGMIAGTLGIFVYLCVCYLLKLEEFELFKNSLKRRWLNLKNRPDVVDTNEM